MVAITSTDNTNKIDNYRGLSNDELEFLRIIMRKSILPAQTYGYNDIFHKKYKLHTNLDFHIRNYCWQSIEDASIISNMIKRSERNYILNFIHSSYNQYVYSAKRIKCWEHDIPLIDEFLTIEMYCISLIKCAIQKNVDNTKFRILFDALKLTTNTVNKLT